MNFDGIVIGATAFFIIGIFHPIVIKSEYYFTDKIWPLFLVCGVIFLGISTVLSNSILSACVGVLGCTCLWSVIELKEQTERVKKGWFPKNPKR